MPTRPRLLSLGDRVRYDGREHTVAALHGTSVRLADDAQAASVVLLGHMLASEGFTVLSTSLTISTITDSHSDTRVPGGRDPVTD
ncbi:hypothetical protein [Streptomyces sp. TRM70350]|uniref:hypothetical protein n=1 Tax=Streptomyces sp. TRM70350 TaxID=2856165 RepID=UPI00210F538E|nr:hypothetical protein [Streptomyces sp. TRM70350]